MQQETAKRCVRQLVQIVPKREKYIQTDPFELDDLIKDYEFQIHHMKADVRQSRVDQEHQKHLMALQQAELQKLSRDNKSFTDSKQKQVLEQENFNYERNSFKSRIE